ncbi:MAG: alpha/beta fold hydrolase [Acidobacteriota bacterium]
MRPATSSLWAGQQPAAPVQELPATFTIFIQAIPVGTEQVTVTKDAGGCVIRATGRLGVPINLSTARFELRYDADWRPVSLVIESSLRGQPLILGTHFADGTATSNITQAGQQSQKTDQVAPDTVVLPNMFFAAYEALALRLASVDPGTELKAYIAPQLEIPLTVGAGAREQITTTARVINARRYSLTVVNPGGPLPVELWADEANRLLRVRIPSQSLEVAREDVASVSSRVERMARANDEQVQIEAAGFTLAATISMPAEAQSGPLPAVVLVPGLDRVDRDQTAAGIPVYAQLADALASSGFLTIRYDRRGVGQSGGRDEAATIADYAEDARTVVKYVERRKGLDKRRITLLGYSEGGFIAMLAASKEKKKVAAVALIATPGTTGGELVLEQQRHLLDGMNLPEYERQARMDLQRKVQAAVVSGSGWDEIPPAYRRQADTPWYRSFLTFDPDKVLSKVEQPVGIFQGERDREVPARHARRLLELAQARKRNRGAELGVIDGLNHLLVPAATGEVGEYASLEDKDVSRSLIDTLVSWIRRTSAAAGEAK